ATVNWSDRLRLYDGKTHKEKTIVLKKKVRWADVHIAFSPDGKLVACGGPRGGRGDEGWGERVWGVATGKQKAMDSWELSGGEGLALTFSPDGKLLAVGGEHGRVSVWDWGQKKRVLYWEAGGVVCSVAFSPDGKLLASGGRDRVVRLWTLPPTK